MFRQPRPLWHGSPIPRALTALAALALLSLPAAKADEDERQSRRLEDSAVFGSSNEYNLDLSVPAARLSPLEQALRAGAEALQQGRLAGGDDTAQAHYLRAFELDAGNADARQALAQIAQRLATDANTSIDAGDLAAARSLIDQIAAYPGPIDVPALQAQAAQREETLAVTATLRSALSEPLQNDETPAQRRGKVAALADKLSQLDANHPASIAAKQVARHALGWTVSAALAAGDVDAAEARLRELQALDPEGSRGSALERAVTAAEAKRWQRAITRAERSVEVGDLEATERLLAVAHEAGAPAGRIEPISNRVLRARVLASYRPGQVVAPRLPDTPETVVLPSPDPDTPPVAMATTEVTVAQFRQFIEATGYVTDAERYRRTTMYDGRSGELKPSKKLNWRHGFNGGGAKDSAPVIHVSWNDAYAYAAWLREVTGAGYRLPSSAEFSHALRGGSNTRYWWGNQSPSAPVTNVAGDGDSYNGRWQWPESFQNYEDGHWGPAPVASYARNGYGLADMGGNVMEWVADCADEDIKDCTQRLVRDASWASTPARAHVDFKAGAAPDSASCLVGFRVARDLAEDKLPPLVAKE